MAKPDTLTLSTLRIHLLQPLEADGSSLRPRWFRTLLRLIRLSKIGCETAVKLQVAKANMAPNVLR